MIRPVSFVFVAIVLVAVLLVGCEQEPDEEELSPGATSQAEPSPSVVSQAEPSPTAASQAESDRRLAFVSVRDGAYRLYTMNLDGGDVRRVSDQPVASLSAFSVSQDETQVALLGGDASGSPSPCVYRVDVMGGHTELIGQVPPDAWQPLVMPPRWQTDDGVVLAWVGGPDLCYAVPSGGGEVREESTDDCVCALTEAEGPEGSLAAVVGASLVVREGPTGVPRVLDKVMVPKSEGEEGAGWDVMTLGTMQSMGALRPLWSPDGKWIAYVRYDSDIQQTSIVVVSVEGGEPRVLVQPGTASGDLVFPAAWSPDSKRVVFAGSDEEASAIKEVAVDDGSIRTLVGGDGYIYLFPQWVTETPPPQRPGTPDAATLWTTCGAGDESEADLDLYFLRDLAAVQAAGLAVYWLGTEFTVDGHVLRGPYGDPPYDEVEGDSISMSYRYRSEGAYDSLGLTVYHRDAWELAKDRILKPPVPGVTRRAVTVGSREGELLFLPLGTRPLNILRLVLDLGDVVVVAQAQSGGPVFPGGPDYSLFINNPDLLVQVMEGLRPYPQ